jgi:RNA polymerase sigma-70 factor, ECF subfamily
MPSSSEDNYARALVESHPRVLRYFKRVIPHEAEDLASDVLLATWTALKTFRGDASIDTLAFRISSRVLSRRRRQLKRALSAEPYDPSGEGDGEGRASLADPNDHVGISTTIAMAVRIALGKLTPPLARVVELSYVQGKTQRETSEILGLAPGTVASRLRRAKDHLRAELSQVAQLVDNESAPSSGMPELPPVGRPTSA